MLVFNNFSNPQLGRWWQIDPEVEQFEAWSAYNSNLDNPILHTDPEGDCTDCPSELTVGGLLETAFYDAKHALFNVGAYGVQLATGSEGRYVADYQTDGSGTPIFETSYKYVTNETQGQKALSLAGDVLQVASLANGGASSLTLAKTTNQSKQTVKAVSNVGRSGKDARLRELANDPKLGKADKGWLKQEINSVKNGSKRMSKDGTLKPQKNIRNPPGKDLAHPRGQRAKDGNSYKNAKLQDKDLHKLEHKHEGYK